MDLIARPESHVAENKPDHLPDTPYRLLFGCSYDASHQATTFTNMANILERHFDVENISALNLSKTIGTNALQSQILSVIDKFDIFLVHCGKPVFDFNFYKKLKNINKDIIIAYIDGDSHINFLGYSNYLVNDIDLFISVDSIYMADYFAQLGTRSVCLGNVVNQQDFHPLGGTQKDIDVSFYGGIKGDRQQFLDRIKAENFDLQCFGRRFGNKPSHEELNRIICRSKIGLAFNKYGESPDKIKLPKNIPLSIPIKSHMFEYMLCGSFVLSEYIENIDRFFVPDKELVSFKDETELIDKIQYYLDHPETREEIAEAGHKKVMAHFEGTMQITKMANLILKVTNEKRGFKETYSDENRSYNVKPISDLDEWTPNKQHFVNFRAGSAYRFFKANKYRLALSECKAFRYGLPYLFIKTQLKYAVFGFLGRRRIQIRELLGIKLANRTGSGADSDPFRSV